MTFQADIDQIKADLANWPGKVEGRIDSYSVLVDKVATNAASTDEIVQGGAAFSLGAQADMAKIASIWIRLGAAYAKLDI